MVFSFLKKRMNSQGTVSVKIGGLSMMPVLQPDSLVQVRSEQYYDIGDVIVFYYKSTDSIIVHRILDRKDGEYICKGDNCFRLERVGDVDILGKVVGIPFVSESFVKQSYQVGVEFIKNSYNENITKESMIYKEYSRKYLSQ